MLFGQFQTLKSFKPRATGNLFRRKITALCNHELSILATVPWKILNKLFLDVKYKTNFGLQQWFKMLSPNYTWSVLECDGSEVNYKDIVLRSTLRPNKRKRHPKVKERKRRVPVSSSLTTIKLVVNIQAWRKLFPQGVVGGGGVYSGF